MMSVAATADLAGCTSVGVGHDTVRVSDVAHSDGYGVIAFDYRPLRGNIGYRMPTDATYTVIYRKPPGSRGRLIFVEITGAKLNDGVLVAYLPKRVGWNVWAVQGPMVEDRTDPGVVRPAFPTIQVATEMEVMAWPHGTCSFHYNGEEFAVPERCDGTTPSGAHVNVRAAFQDATHVFGTQMFP